MSNCENGHSRDKIIVEINIREYKKAIENIGGDYMQKILISTDEVGIGQALQSGKYINLSDESFVYAGIKQALKKMLKVQEDILEEINAN